LLVWKEKFSWLFTYARSLRYKVSNPGPFTYKLHMLAQSQTDEQSLIIALPDSYFIANWRGVCDVISFVSQFSGISRALAPQVSYIKVLVSVSPLSPRNVLNSKRKLPIYRSLGGVQDAMFVLTFLKIYLTVLATYFKIEDSEGTMIGSIVWTGMMIWSGSVTDKEKRCLQTMLIQRLKPFSPVKYESPGLKCPCKCPW